MNFKVRKGKRFSDFRGFGRCFALFYFISALVIFAFSSLFTTSSCTDLKELPPTAGPLLVLSPSEVYGEYPLKVSFAIRAIPSRGGIKEIIIDFGDGTIQDIKSELRNGEAVISHTYDRIGVFDVVLSALDEAGAGQVRKTIITNDRPEIKNFSSYADREFLEPLSNFLPGDTVYIKASCYDRNGISNVIINWGDGTFTETASCEGQHIYINEGDFEIEMMVIDANRFAPYPLSSSAKIKVSVFAQAGSMKNSPPDVSLTLEDVGSNGIKLGDVVIGQTPLDVVVLIGTSDRDGSVQKVVIDWGDGQSSLPKNLIQESGSRKIFRETHRYEKEGEFFITVIAEDDKGKKGIGRIGPISTYKTSPVIYLEPREISTGEDVRGKTYSTPITIKTKVVSYDAKTSTNYIYVSVKYKGIEGEEIFARKIGETQELDVIFDELELSAKGDYEITYWVVPSPDEFECAYCSSSDAFNASFENMCFNRQFGGLASCEEKISKLNGILNSLKINSKASFKVSIK